MGDNLGDLDHSNHNIDGAECLEGVLEVVDASMCLGAVSLEHKEKELYVGDPR